MKEKEVMPIRHVVAVMLLFVNRFTSSVESLISCWTLKLVWKVSSMLARWKLHSLVSNFLSWQVNRTVALLSAVDSLGRGGGRVLVIEAMARRGTTILPCAGDTSTFSFYRWSNWWESSPESAIPRRSNFSGRKQWSGQEFQKGICLFLWEKKRRWRDLSWKRICSENLFSVFHCISCWFHFVLLMTCGHHSFGWFE